MKFRFSLLGVIVMLLAVTLPPDRAGAEMPRHVLKPADAMYLALGDSLATGVGATSWVQQGYVGRFNSHYMSKARLAPRSLINLSVPGETSASMAQGKQLRTAVYAIHDHFTDVEVLTLNIGGNDLLNLLLAPGSPCGLFVAQQATCQTAVRETVIRFSQNYTIILQTLTGALAATETERETLLVMAYYNPLDGTGLGLESVFDQALLGADGRIDCQAATLDPANAGMNDVIACTGRRYGARVVDAYPLFVGQAPSLTHIGVLDIHPNNAGYERIAEAFIKTAEG